MADALKALQLIADVLEMLGDYDNLVRIARAAIAKANEEAANV